MSEQENKQKQEVEQSENLESSSPVEQEQKQENEDQDTQQINNQNDEKQKESETTEDNKKSQNQKKQQEEKEEEEYVPSLSNETQQKEENQSEIVQNKMQQQEDQLEKEEEIQQQPQTREKQSSFDASDVKKTIRQRKTDCFKQLQEWDGKRTRFLQNHYQLIQIILSQVDQRIQLSNQFLQHLINYFDSRAKQETQYANFPIYKIEEKFQQNPILDQLYGSHNSHLFKLQEEQLKRSQKSAELAQYIWDQVLSQSLLKHANEKKKEFEEMYHLIGILQKQLNQYHQKASKKSQTLSSVYSAQQEQKSMLNLKQKKDLFKCLLGFLRVTEHQRDNQRNLAKHVLRFYHKARLIESERQNVMKEAIASYQEAYLKCYGKFDNEIEVFNLENGNKTEIEQVYDINKLLGEQYVRFLQNELKNSNQIIKNSTKPQQQEKAEEQEEQKDQQNKENNKTKENEKGEQQIEEDQQAPFEPISEREVQMFIEDFNIQPFEDRVLVLKSMQIFREIGPNQFIDTKLQISVDGHLHLTDLHQDPEERKKYEKPTVVTKLHKPYVKKLSNLIVEVKNKENILVQVFEAGKRNILKFNGDEEIQEFTRFIQLF